MGEDLCFQNFEEELQYPLKKYSPPTGALFLCYYNNAIAGCIALQNIGNKNCEMKRLYVVPAYRKNKIGEALVLHLLQVARQLGYANMKLDTLQKLQAAIALYFKLGFTETTAYYPNPIEGVIYMEKKL